VKGPLHTPMRSSRSSQERARLSGAPLPGEERDGPSAARRGSGDVGGGAVRLSLHQSSSTSKGPYSARAGPPAAQPTMPAG
jgi:hypothetical protein